MFFVVVPSVGDGQTVAGFCNATLGSGLNDTIGPWGIDVSPSDGSFYVADWDAKRFQAFLPFSRTGYTIFSTGIIEAMDVFVDSSNTIYMTDLKFDGGTIFIQQAGVNLRSMPAAGASTSSCSLNGLYGAYSVTLDRSGNIYVAVHFCHIVVMWAPNATYGTVVAGQAGISGSTNDKLNQPRFIYLDKDRDAIYVTEKTSHRVQKFIIGGNGTAVTVVGNGTAGIGLNQLNGPGGICVTRDGLTLYVADYNNHRVMKWMIGASQGSVIAGSASGVAGSTSQLLNGPGDVALDATETYLYVSDYNNHRVQRFRL